MAPRESVGSLPRRTSQSLIDGSCIWTFTATAGWITVAPALPQQRKRATPRAICAAAFLRCPESTSGASPRTDGCSGQHEAVAERRTSKALDLEQDRVRAASGAPWPSGKVTRPMEQAVSSRLASGPKRLNKRRGSKHLVAWRDDRYVNATEVARVVGRDRHYAACLAPIAVSRQEPSVAATRVIRRTRNAGLLRRVPSVGRDHRRLLVARSAPRQATRRERNDDHARDQRATHESKTT